MSSGFDRSRSLRVGLLSGGYGEEELIQTGAFRVYCCRNDRSMVTRRRRHLTSIQNGEGGMDCRP